MVANTTNAHLIFKTMSIPGITSRVKAVQGTKCKRLFGARISYHRMRRAELYSKDGFRDVEKQLLYALERLPFGIANETSISYKLIDVSLNRLRLRTGLLTYIDNLIRFPSA